MSAKQELLDGLKLLQLGDKMQLRLPRSAYLESCARIRGITPSSLVRRLIRIIDSDQLVGSILDDADEIKRRHKHETRYREA